MHERVPWLQRGDPCDFLCSLHLLHVEIRNPDPAHFSFTLQFRHRAPTFFKFCRILDRPMDLVEIDRLHLEPTQTVLAFPTDGQGAPGSARCAQSNTTLARFAGVKTPMPA